MTCLICLTIRYRNKNSSMILKKKGDDYQYIIKLNQSNVLPEQVLQIAVLSKFEIGEEARTQLYTNDNICPKDQLVYM